MTIPTSPSGQSLTIDAVTHRYGDVRRGRPRDARDQGRRAGRVARAVRLRQDHAAAHHRRLRRADAKGRSWSARSAIDDLPPNRRDGRHRVPELRAVSAHDRGREHRLWPRGARRAARGAAGARRRDAGAGPARAPRRSLSQAAFRRPAAARRAGARARGEARASCCSTSRSPRSTRTCGSTCRSRSSASSGWPAPPRSWSRTTRRRRCRWPTASPCSTRGGWSSSRTPIRGLRHAALAVRQHVRRHRQHAARQARRARTARRRSRSTIGARDQGACAGRARWRSATA